MMDQPKKFTTKIASAGDRERLVCKIFENEEQVAEISCESLSKPRIDIYPPLSRRYWEFDYEEFLSALHDAKDMLLDRYSSEEERT